MLLNVILNVDSDVCFVILSSCEKLHLIEDVMPVNKKAASTYTIVL